MLPLPERKDIGPPGGDSGLQTGLGFGKLPRQAPRTSWQLPGRTARSPSAERLDPATIVVNITYCSDWLREGVKKNGLFSDIDHISFNTHPPPPKNDM